MTRALYHEQATQPANQLNFTTVVSEVVGNEVALEATAFYPEGGGQPGDMGLWHWESDAGQRQSQVLGTRKDKATGLIWHQLAGEIPAPGTTITGEVDAARRWRHTQRHSGEHLLAQAFARVNPAFQVAAVSMNSPECHLDLRGDPAESHVRAAEALLRETLGRDELTLETPIVPETELANYPLRRETKITGQVRLVIFRDALGHYFDVSACGGTHVPRAAICAPVVILRTERIKGGLTRVTFMAGEEASEYLAGVYRESRALAQGFSVPVERLPERVEALKAERDGLRLQLEMARQALARQLLQAAPTESLPQTKIKLIELDDAELLGPLLSQPLLDSEVVAAVHASGRCGIASAHAAVPAGDLLRRVLALTGGKGGGKPELAQGQTEKPEQFAVAVRTVLGSGG